jgi:hypothetical protein
MHPGNQLDHFADPKGPQVNTHIFDRIQGDIVINLPQHTNDAQLGHRIILLGAENQLGEGIDDLQLTRLSVGYGIIHVSA